MTEASVHDAWNTFWKREAGKPSGKQQASMSRQWNGMVEKQRRVWQSFARPLPRRARVLDLATGEGSVLRHIREKRTDLELVGVDRAPVLPAAPDGIVVHPNVPMEKLPIREAAFDAVTSQFGFEYGNVEKTAVEIGRVLKRGGRLGMITHRINGSIVAHNRKRRQQIGWAITEQRLPEIAKESLRLRAAGRDTIPQAIEDAPATGVEVHGKLSAAWEIAEAIRQTLEMGRNDDPEKVEAVIEKIEEQAENELGRIASLEQAASIASDADHIICVLESAGMQFVDEAMLTDGKSSTAFADYRTFRRSG